METMPRHRPGAGFTLVELLVVVSIVATLLAVLLPALGAARESARRVECASNLRQFAIALFNYAEVYGRYPHQRQVTRDVFSPEGPVTRFGGPMIEPHKLGAQPISGVGWEFDALLAVGFGARFEPNASAPMPTAARMLACPNLGVGRNTHWSNGTETSGVNGNPSDEAYVWVLGYFYLGGSHYWTHAEPTYSPIRPTDPGQWALASDIVLRYDRSEDYRFAGHRRADGTPAGSNHAFNDGHVAWVNFAAGETMRMNTDWTLGEGEPRQCFWRRTVHAP